MSMSREITERHARQVRAFVAGEAAATGASELDVFERLLIAAEQGGRAAASSAAPGASCEFRDLVAAEMSLRVTK
jgi:hypothetical protein